MSDCIEVLFASTDYKEGQMVACYDPHIGSALMTYKGGGGIPKRCLSIIGQDYLISGHCKKPILQVWQLNQTEQLSHVRMIIAGNVSALSVSPDGNYCIAGIKEKIYIWDISKGHLLNTITHHYQTITKIIFMDNSTHFITSGEDGIVLVWKLADVVAKHTGNVFNSTFSNLQPVYNFAHHSLPVTDIFTGHGNLKSRLFTVSADQTCKIYSLTDGSLLLSVIFNYLLTAVVANELETELFVGTNCGKIKAFRLEPYPRTLEHHADDSFNNGSYFTGHEKAVNCLAVSVDGRTLASGSDDEKIMIWDITSRQLLKTLMMKGPVTNLFFNLSCKNIFNEQFVPTLALTNFEKVSDPDKSGLDYNALFTEELRTFNLEGEFEDEDVFKETAVHSDKNEVNEDEVKDLKLQVEKLKKINKELYEFALDKIITNPLAFDGTETSFMHKKARIAKSKNKK